MGMDLYRITDGAYFRWSIHYWPVVLALALRYGWEPISPTGANTIRCSCEHLDSYYRNDGRIVTDEDAKAMAAALEKALPDIPSQEAIIDKTANPEVCAKANLSKPLSIEDLIQFWSLVAGGKNSGTLIVGGCFTPEVWDTLNCFEKLAAAKGKLKDFITYLRGGAFEMH